MAEPPREMHEDFRKRVKKTEAPLVIGPSHAADASLERRARDELVGKRSSALHIPAWQAEAQGDVPLLIANMLPGLKEAKSDRERFELNMAARPAELDPHDDAFDKVPIEEFGMAMLRGMGYREDVGVGKGDNARTVQPYLLEGRPALLGLGAKPKPGDVNPRQRGRAYVAIGSLVRLQSGAYGVVTQTDGVPGLECVRVHALLPGADRATELVVPRKTLVLEGDPTALPEGHPARAAILAHERETRAAPQPAAAAATDDDGGGASLAWLRKGLVVKVVDEAHAQFKQKCQVVAVTGARTCELRAPDGSLHSAVPQHSVQTVVPKPRGAVVVVQASAGARAGEAGVVEELDKKQQRALVRVGERSVWLAYDAVCQTSSVER